LFLHVLALQGPDWHTAPEKPVAQSQEPLKIIQIIFFKIVFFLDKETFNIYTIDSVSALNTQTAISTWGCCAKWLS
jgi:hypothetical protein